MVRPLRLQFPNAVYHVTARGNARQKIVFDDGDRSRFIQLLARTVNEKKLCLYAWVLMDNHYHLLVETPNANLSKAMRQLNGIYTQWFNKKHRRVGHVLQGRYKAILVDKDSYLMELCRYVVLNPVRAGLVASPKAYYWSSYRSTAGHEPPPEWLKNDYALKLFHGNQKIARNVYRQYVFEGIGMNETPWEKLEGQMYLGTSEFLDGIKSRVKTKSAEVPLYQRRVRCLKESEILRQVCDMYDLKDPAELFRRRRDGEARRMAMYWLRVEGGLGLKEIGSLFRVSYTTVSHLVNKVRCELETSKSIQRKILNRNPKT